MNTETVLITVEVDSSQLQTLIDKINEAIESSDRISEIISSLVRECPSCGQYGFIKSECLHCGAPIS